VSTIYFLLTAKDPLGNTTVYEYNAADRLTKRTDPLLRTTNYETDYRGRVTAAVDPGANRGRINLLNLPHLFAIGDVSGTSANKQITMNSRE